MKNQGIKIGNFSLQHPIIQGGMGVGISLGNLAGTVAKNGAMGVISMADVGYLEDDFNKNPMQANKRGFKKEVEKARNLAQSNGIIAVNIMRALSNFEEYVKMAVEEKIDAIIVGAGMPLNLPELVKGSGALIAPIVSSVRALKLILKKWKNNYHRLPDFIVLEGPKAGGHLGFSRQEIDDDSFKIENLTKQVSDFLNSDEDLEDKIPFFSAGGIDTKEKIDEIIDLGASGVQIATPFILTDECDASLEYKKVIQKATKDDIKIIQSPVGLPGRAVKTPLLERLTLGRIAPKRCIDCISHCNPKDTLYCITDALISAVKGDYENGLFFCGANGGNNKAIRSVKELIEELVYGKKLQ